MIKRNFIELTPQEIEQREKMYSEADLLGIDLMSYDNSEQKSVLRRDRRKAILLLGTGAKVPPELRRALIEQKKNKQ